MRRRGLAEAVDLVSRAFPEDWEAPPGAAREALVMAREAAVALVEAAHAIAAGAPRQAERAAKVARRAHEAAKGHGSDLRARMFMIGVVDLAAQDPSRASTSHWHLAAGASRDVFAAAVSAWRGEAPGVRRWDGVATLVRSAKLGRYSGTTLHRQWKAWRAQARGDF